MDIRVSFCDHSSNRTADGELFDRRQHRPKLDSTGIVTAYDAVAFMNDTTAHIANWHEIVLATLKNNDVKLAVYVPDRVFTPLIAALHADDFFTTFACTREEEALGIVTGAWMGGMRGAVLMQTSGFGTIPNALASLVVPSQIPALIFVSERGTLGEFNLGQAMVCKTMRPVLNSLAVENITITRLDELEFIVDRSIKQAVATQAPVTFILSPLLTGGKVFGS